MSFSQVWSGLVLCMFLALAPISQKSAHGKNINTYAGPYIVYVNRFYNGESNGQLLPWTYYLRSSHFNPHKPKEVQLVDGNVTGVNVAIDNTCWLKLVMDVWAQNQWKENAFIFHFKDKACGTFKAAFPDVYRVIFKALNASVDCRLPPDVYKLDHEPVKWIVPQVPVMVYGHYKYKIFIGNAKIRYASLVVEINIIPKPD